MGFFPLHDMVELMELENRWLRFVQFPWKQKVDDVKDYFGESAGAVNVLRDDELLISINNY